MASDSSKVRIEIEAAVGDVSKIEAALKDVGAQITKTEKKTKDFGTSATETNAQLDMLDRSLSEVQRGFTNLYNVAQRIDPVLGETVRQMSEIAASAADMMQGLANLEKQGINLNATFDRTAAANMNMSQGFSVVGIVVNTLTSSFTLTQLALDKLNDAYRVAGDLVGVNIPSWREFGATVVDVKGKIDSYIATMMGLGQYVPMLGKSTQELANEQKILEAASEFAGKKITSLSEALRINQEALRGAAEATSNLSSLQAGWANMRDQLNDEQVMRDAKRYMEDQENYKKELEEKKAAEDAARKEKEAADAAAQQALQERLDYNQKQADDWIATLQAEADAHAEARSKEIQGDEELVESEGDVAEAVTSTASAVKEAASSWDTYLQKMRDSMDSAKMWAQDAASLNQQIQQNAGQARDVGHTEAYWEGEAEKIRSRGGEGTDAALEELRQRRDEEKKLMEELVKRQRQDMSEDNLRRIRELLDQLGGGL